MKDESKSEKMPNYKRSLKQLAISAQAAFIYDETRGYDSLEKLHTDIKDLEYFLKKLKHAAKLES